MRPTEPARPQAAARPAAATPATKGKLPDHVGVIAMRSAATAVLFLVILAQTAAMILNPHGRAGLDQIVSQAGVSAAQRPGILVLYEVTLILLSLLPAILHAAAFYGLKERRRAGWIVAFLLSIGWSLVLVGIPFAILLWRRDTREAFGIS